MRTYEEIVADAKPGSAFSNHSQYEYWADGPRGCWSCTNDDEQTEKYCPILSAAVCDGVTPKEWTTATAEEDLHGNYTCTEYDWRPDDDDDGDDDPAPEPGPPPVIEGQLDLGDLFALAGGGRG